MFSFQKLLPNSVAQRVRVVFLPIPPYLPPNLSQIFGSIACGNQFSSDTQKMLPKVRCLICKLEYKLHVTHSLCSLTVFPFNLSINSLSLYLKYQSLNKQDEGIFRRITQSSIT